MISQEPAASVAPPATTATLPANPRSPIGSQGRGVRVEIEPGEFNAEDLAKRIYRQFSEKEEDRACLKSIASVDQIIQFLSPAGSRIKGAGK